MAKPTIKQIEKRLVGVINGTIQYESDHIQYSRPEYWVDLYEMLKVEDKAKGDCEDMALTSAHILWKDFNVRPDHIQLHCVHTNPNARGNSMNHAILSFQFEGKEYWADNYPPYPFMRRRPNYYFNCHCFYHQPKTWYKTVIELPSGD